MKKSWFKKLSKKSKFDRKYACFMSNHSGSSKVKKDNRREARNKLKEDLKEEINIE